MREVGIIPRFPRSTTLVLGLITLLALALRVIQLDLQPLWWDEGYSVLFATRDFPTMLARTALDIHPPLYYALLQLWLLALGKSAIVLRLLSVLIGVAAVPLVSLVARQLFDRRTALAAALLFAIAPLPIYYSQELRMYGLVTLLGLASVSIQLAMLGRDKRDWRLEIGYVVVTTAALYTQYYAAFLLAAEVVVVLYLQFRQRRRTPEPDRWLVRWTAVVVLYLPWVWFAAPKLYGYVTAKVGIEQYSRLEPITFLAQHLTAFSVGHLTEWTWLAWGGVWFVVLALVALAADMSVSRGARAREPLARARAALVGFYLLVPLALGFLVNLLYTFHPVRYERLLLFGAPFFLILVARGVSVLLERRRALGLAAAGVIAALCALALYDFYTVARYPDEDYRPLIAEMEQLAAPQDLVYAVYPWQIGYIEAYYRGAPLDIYEVPSEDWIKDPRAMDEELQALRRGKPRAWILAYQKQGRILEDRLTNEYVNDYVLVDQTFGNTRLEYFAQDDSAARELPEAIFAPDVSAQVHYAALQPPDNVPQLALVRLTWNAATEDYAYSLRVVDAAGSKLAQQDAPILRGTTTLKRGLALPRSLAPGEYSLQLVVYHREGGQPLTLPDGADYLILATTNRAR